MSSAAAPQSLARVQPGARLPILGPEPQSYLFPAPAALLGHTFIYLFDKPHAIYSQGTNPVLGYAGGGTEGQITGA